MTALGLPASGELGIVPEGAQVTVVRRNCRTVGDKGVLCDASEVVLLRCSMAGCGACIIGPVPARISTGRCGSTPPEPFELGREHGTGGEENLRTGLLGMAKGGWELAPVGECTTVTVCVADILLCAAVLASWLARVERRYRVL